MMATLLALAFEYRYLICILLALAIYAIFEWTNFKIKAYAIMLQAKSLAKDMVLKSGKEQEDWVIEKIYIFTPRIKLLPEKYIRGAVHYLFIKAKDFLDDGTINNSWLPDEELDNEKDE